MGMDVGITYVLCAPMPEPQVPLAKATPPICVPVSCAPRSCLATRLRLSWTSPPRCLQCLRPLLSSPHPCQKCCLPPPLMCCLGCPAPWPPWCWRPLRACLSRLLLSRLLLPCRCPGDLESQAPALPSSWRRGPFWRCVPTPQTRAQHAVLAPTPHRGSAPPSRTARALFLPAPLSWDWGPHLPLAPWGRVSLSLGFRRVTSEVMEGLQQAFLGCVLPHRDGQRGQRDWGGDGPAFRNCLAPSI